MELHINAVSPEMLSLIKKLMSIDFLSHYDLVGGTALALQLGHRKSIDIDLFGLHKDDLPTINKNLVSDFGAIHKSINAVMTALTIEGIKVDIVNYLYPKLKPLTIVEGIRFYSLHDIIPMKLSAIAQRGSKKDFWDIYFLLDKFSFTEMLDLYVEKFNVKDPFHVIRSLDYFDQADEDDDPETIIPVKWIDIKKRISSSVKKKVLNN